MTGDRILPVLYSDNFVTLIPGEQKTIIVESEDADTRVEQHVVVAKGLNSE